MKIARFEDIEGWQMARVLTRKVYKVTKSRTFRIDFKLRDQIRDASGSSMHNIAEGFDGGSHAEFARFLGYAHRSCSEVQSPLYIALDETYITQEDFDDIYEQAAATKRKVGAFIKYLKSNK